MKKLLSIVLILLILAAGCTKPAKEAEALKILSPSGAPSLSLIEYVESFGQDTISITEGSDALGAAFLNAEEEYDAIIAPVNLGATMISKNSSYRLVGVVTWGNLYLAARSDLKDSDKEVALFGEQAVPGKIVKACLDLDSFTQSVRWYGAVSEVSAALLSGDASYGLLAEPVLTATLAKAKQSGVKIEIVENMQEAFSRKYGTSTYPQAALFVSSKAWKENKVSVEKLVELLKSLSVDSIAKIDGKEEFYGVPKAAVLTNAFDRMNIGYKDAREARAELSAFLALFNISGIDSLFAE